MLDAVTKKRIVNRCRYSTSISLLSKRAIQQLGGRRQRESKEKAKTSLVTGRRRKDGESATRVKQVQSHGDPEIARKRKLTRRRKKSPSVSLSVGVSGGRGAKRCRRGKGTVVRERVGYFRLTRRRSLALLPIPWTHPPPILRVTHPQAWQGPAPVTARNWRPRSTAAELGVSTARRIVQTRVAPRPPIARLAPRMPDDPLIFMHQPARRAPGPVCISGSPLFCCSLSPDCEPT